MTVIQTNYGTAAQAFTLTLASLAAAAVRASTAVDNSSNLYLDALVMVKVTLSATGPTGDKALYIYAYGTVDPAGPTWPDAVTGSDATITLNSPTQLRMIGAIAAPTASLAYTAGPFSVATAFGGILPTKWGIVVQNASGSALSGSGNSALYQGIEGQAV